MNGTLASSAMQPHAEIGMWTQARRQRSQMRAAAAINADGNNSDDEVYAAAAAAEDGVEAEYDMNDNLVVHGGKRSIEPLPPVDHAEIVYDDFAKDFFEEPEALKALTPAEVCCWLHAGSAESARQAEGSMHDSLIGIPRPVCCSCATHVHSVSWTASSGEDQAAGCTGR